MRDNSEGLPELLDAYERDDYFFGVVRIRAAGQVASFEFGVSADGYSALKRVFNARPFDATPGLRYRYFFAGTYGKKKLGEEPALFHVRIEQGTTAKSFEFSGPTSLLANLRWFLELKTLEAASALRRVDQVSQPGLTVIRDTDGVQLECRPHEGETLLRSDDHCEPMRSESGPTVLPPENTPFEKIFEYRSSLFGSAVLCDGETSFVEQYLKPDDFILPFGGWIALTDKVTGKTYLGVWGKRHARRFRRLLRERGASFTLIRAGQPGRTPLRWARYPTQHKDHVSIKVLLDDQDFTENGTD
ncbi:MAG TPA: hypothetical protein VN428_23240 [Bryobacteraceae bacterium]|nr:hypothetical protein [Bryobacteraceae bacterium]